MKVNNFVLFAMLFMLSDVSFSKNLVATKVRPKVRDVYFDKPDPNVKYYIYEFFNVLIADFNNPRRAASTLYTYDH